MDVVVVILDMISTVDDSSDIQQPMKIIEEIGGLWGSASLDTITCPVPSRPAGRDPGWDGTGFFFKGIFEKRVLSTSCPPNLFFITFLLILLIHSIKAFF